MRTRQETGLSLGVIGLGIMGSAIARNCVEAGFKVLGFDVDQARCQALREVGGTPLGAAAALAAAADVVLASLPTQAGLDQTAAVLAAVARPEQVAGSRRYPRCGST